MSSHLELVLDIIVISIPCCVYLPITIWWTWLFYRCRFNQVLAKRYVNVVVAQNVSLSVLSVALVLGGVPVLSKSTHPFFVIGCYGAAYAGLVRIWLLYFNIKYDLTMHEAAWSDIVHNASSSGQRGHHGSVSQIHDSPNFFVKYKPNLGNERFVGFSCFVCWLITSALGTVIYFYSPSGEELSEQKVKEIAVIKFALQTACSLIPVVGIAVFRCKTPKFHDHLMIRQEFKYLFSCMLTAIGLCGLGWMLILIDVAWIKLVGFRLIVLLIATSGFVAAYISTDFILKRMAVRTDAVRVGGGQPQLQKAQSLSLEANDSLLRLKHVLLRDDLFYAFVSHLRHEFSMEIVLCFYVMVWFKKYIQKCFADSLGDTSERDERFLYEFNNGLAKPAWHSDEATVANEEELKEIAFSIYAHFIAVGSEHEINISGVLRSRYKTLLSDYEQWQQKQVSVRDMFCAYDAVIIELCSYLNQSVRRFQNSDTFEKMNMLSSALPSASN